MRRRVLRIDEYGVRYEDMFGNLYFNLDLFIESMSAFLEDPFEEEDEATLSMSAFCWVLKHGLRIGLIRGMGGKIYVGGEMVADHPADIETGVREAIRLWNPYGVKNET